MTAALLAALCLLAADPRRPGPARRPDGRGAPRAAGRPGHAHPRSGAVAAARSPRCRRTWTGSWPYVLRHRLLRELPQAVAALAPLLAAAPHHPAVVTEAVRLRLEQGDFAGALRLGQEERAAQRDSLLVARELAYAAERLGRPAEAAGVVLEAWAASPTVADWARGTLLRLAAAAPGEARERMRRVARARPGRPDLALAAALLDVRAGDLRGALAGLAAAERPAGHASARWGFAQELLEIGAPGDSAAAIAALTALAGDARFAAAQRLAAGERAWELQAARGRRAEAAPALAQALRDVPTRDWPVPFLAELARALREAGRTDEARALLRPGDASHDPVGELELEAALADLRDGPPARVLPRLAALAGRLRGRVAPGRGAVLRRRDRLGDGVLPAHRRRSPQPVPGRRARARLPDRGRRAARGARRRSGASPTSSGGASGAPRWPWPTRWRAPCRAARSGPRRRCCCPPSARPRATRPGRSRRCWRWPTRCPGTGSRRWRASAPATSTSSGCTTRRRRWRSTRSASPATRAPGTRRRCGAWSSGCATRPGREEAPDAPRAHAPGAVRPRPRAARPRPGRRRREVARADGREPDRPPQGLRPRLLGARAGPQGGVAAQLPRRLVPAARGPGHRARGQRARRRARADGRRGGGRHARRDRRREHGGGRAREGPARGRLHPAQHAALGRRRDAGARLRRHPLRPGVGRGGAARRAGAVRLAPPAPRGLHRPARQVLRRLPRVPLVPGGGARAEGDGGRARLRQGEPAQGRGGPGGPGLRRARRLPVRHVLGHRHLRHRAGRRGRGHRRRRLRRRPGRPAGAAEAGLHAHARVPGLPARARPAALRASPTST